MEWMCAWEALVVPSQKGSIMEISGVGMGSATPGITFATINYPNSIKAVNSTSTNMGSVCYYKIVPLIVSAVLIMVATTRTSPVTAMIT